MGRVGRKSDTAQPAPNEELRAPPGSACKGSIALAILAEGV